ncbi:Small glutamine-rich tetratricopeptide repeat-containing protein alpha, partial [Thalictrum thalictroides]
DEDCVGELHTSGVSKDELFGHFFAELDKIRFFSTTNDGADDSWLLDRATNLFHEAVKELERSGCQTIDSLNLAETFKLQGNRAMQSKLYSDAIELYTYAIALCQSNSVYYCNRAAAFTQIHKYIEAITDCKRSIEIDPNYSKAYSRLGLAYYAQGNYRDAIDKGFMKALQLDPNNSSVKENIRVAEQKLRDLHRTEQHQNGRSSNHSNQESTNGQARDGPRNRSVPSSVFTDMNFNPADLPSDITRMFVNMVGQHPQGANDGTDTGSSDEPGIRFGGNFIPGGNFSVDIGEEMPVDLMGSLRSVMERFSGAAQPHQNPQGDVHRGPAPN